MFRVLMTADSGGGVWCYALDLARELGGQGIEVVLASMGRPLNRDQRQSIREIPTLEVHESSYRLEWMEDPWRDVKDAGNWLLDLCEEVQPDVVHLNNYCHSYLNWHCPTLVVAHSDVYSWYRAVQHQEPDPEWQRYHEEVGAGLRAADLVVSPSRATLDNVIREYGGLERTRVIPNGRRPGIFAPNVKERMVVSVGRIWDEAKNIKALDSVAGQIDVPVFVAGANRNPDGNSTQFSNLQSLGEITPDEIADYLSRASIYALPAKYEPFGLSVLEAAMSGCALVLGDIPSLRENWEHAAEFVNPNDPGSIRDVIQRLLDDGNHRNYLAGRARERSKFFSARRMAETYVQEYRQLMKPSLSNSQNQFLPRNLKPEF